MKYLLSQSDIFSHFGAARGFSSSTQKAVADSSNKSSKHRGSTADEMDDDEKAMAQEIGEGDDDDMIDENQATVLLRQPSCISGGEMRLVMYFIYVMHFFLLTAGTH